MERKNTRGEAPPEGVGVWARREMEGSPGWDEAVWRQTEEREEAFLVPALKTEALSTHFAKVTSRFVLVRSSSRTKLEVDACPRRPTRLLLIAESRLPCGAGAAERIVIQLMTSDRKLRRPERARNEGSTGPTRLDDTRCTTYRCRRTASQGSATPAKTQQRAMPTSTRRTGSSPWPPRLRRS